MGLHQNKRSQQGKGRDPAPLLCADEATPGVLHPHGEFSVQERHGPFGAHTEKGHRNDPTDGTSPLQERRG